MFRLPPRSPDPLWNRRAFPEDRSCRCDACFGARHSPAERDPEPAKREPTHVTFWNAAPLWLFHTNRVLASGKVPVNGINGGCSETDLNVSLPLSGFTICTYAIMPPSQSTQLSRFSRFCAAGTSEVRNQMPEVGGRRPALPNCSNRR